MDLNLTILAGRLAATPELVTFESGSTLLRLLVSVRTEEPRRRIDVIPVVIWEPNGNILDAERGERVHITGSAQRRFWSANDGRTSRVEIVAQHVEVIKERKEVTS